ncbi:MAG: hypothetical protein PF484_03140 [Bacteroidales bacterium]|jgi:hypothetical protein|nr:hypothetical protein [Bacteroidales bacterium]
MKKHKIQLKLTQWSKLIALVLVFTVALGGSSCKSKKKIAAEKAAIELANKIALAKASLFDLLRDDNPKTYEEKIAELKRIKDMQLRNYEIEQLIDQVEPMLAAEYQELLRKQEAERKRQDAELIRIKKQAELDNINAHFISIAQAENDLEANLRIQQTLTYYASPNVPVLLIINIYGDSQKDYDKPTTIEHYLNYLKDVKTYSRQIESIKLDVNHKIIEIELIKK